MNPVRRASDALVLFAVATLISFALVAVPESAEATTTCVGTTTVTCTYSTPGAHTFTVPVGITSVTIVVNGAGGAGGASIASGAGGSGTRVTATRTVTGGQTLALVVGGGGGIGGGAGGGGGGASTVDVSDTTNRIVAGGGGGGGARTGGGAGGNGAAACGGTGGSGEDAVTGGGGGGCAGVGSAGAGGAGEVLGSSTLNGAGGTSTSGGDGGGDGTNSAGGSNGGGRGGYGGLYGVSPWSASGGGGGGGGIGGGGGGGGATGSSGYGVSGGGAGGGGAGGSTGPSGATYGSAGNGASPGYPGGSGSITVTYTKSAQTITFTDPGSKTFGGADFGVSASATSGLAVTFTSDTTPVCTVSGTTVSLVGAGTCTILADQGGDEAYSPAPQVSRSFTVNKADQTVSFSGPTSFAHDTEPGISASSTSGLDVTISSWTPSVCTTDGSTVAYAGAGTCTLKGDQGGDGDYNAATQATLSFTVAKGAQTIDFGSFGNHTFGVAPFDVHATASSGLEVEFTSETPDVCTISGVTLTVGGAGTCTIAADQPGDHDWNPAPQVTSGFDVAKADQTIDITEMEDLPTFGDDPFGVEGIAESGLAVAYSTLTPEVCTNVGDTVTIVTGGWCVIAFDQLGDDDWNAAPQVTSTFPILQASQKVSFPALSDTVFGDDPFDVSAFASSGLRVGFASATPEVCEIISRTVTALTPGTCLIRAYQSGDVSYLAAPSVTRDFTVAPTPQTITFRSIGGMSFGDDPFVLTATASSGLPVSFSSLTPSVCTVAGSTATIVTGGECTIAADQSGDLLFAPAPGVQSSFGVGTAGVEITIGTIADATVGDDSFDVEASASSGLPVTLTSGTPDICTVVGATVTIVAEGLCTIVADSAADARYAAAQASVDFDVAPAPEGTTGASGGQQDDGDDGDGGGAGTIIIVLLAAAAAVGGGVFFVRRRN